MKKNSHTAILLTYIYADLWYCLGLLAEKDGEEHKKLRSAIEHAKQNAATAIREVLDLQK